MTWSDGMIRSIAMSTFLVSLLLLFTENIVSALSVESDGEQTKVLIVDQNGFGDYNSIQTAINNAKPGSTIYVNQGLYNEIIEIKKSVVLIGEGRDVTFINSISDENKYAIRLGAPFITIKGFSIHNGAPGLYTSGVRITSSHSRIIECFFYDNPIGITVWSSNNLIENCIFKGCSDEGIVLLGCEYSKCKNNQIINCVFYDNTDGIELQHSSNNIIINCEIYDNTHSGIDAIASSNNKNMIRNCRIYNNSVHGIYLSKSFDNKIIDCEIFNNLNGDVINTRNSGNNQIINGFKSDLYRSVFEKISSLMINCNLLFENNFNFLGKYKF
jgi:parallel beta-helix repeat protein